MMPTADSFRGTVLAAAARGAWPEVREALDVRRDAAAAHPELLTLLAEALLRLGRSRDAHEWLRAQMHTLERSGDRAAMRRGTNLLGATAFNLGNLSDAEHAFEQALELGRRDADTLLVARATNNLGLIANSRGKQVEAIARYLLAIPAYQKLGHLVGLAESFHNMAIAYRQLSQFARADDAEQRALEYAREAGNQRLVAMAMVGRAEIALVRGDAALAEVTGMRAAQAFDGIHDGAMAADALRLTGVARHALGLFADARDVLDRAVALAVRDGSALIEAESRKARAETRSALGEHEGAQEDVARASEIFERLASSRRPGRDSS